MSFLKCEEVEAIVLQKRTLIAPNFLVWELLCAPSPAKGPLWGELMSDNCCSGTLALPKCRANVCYSQCSGQPLMYYSYEKQPLDD